MAHKKKDQGEASMAKRCQESTGTNLGLSMSTSGATTFPMEKTSTVPRLRGTKTLFA